MSLGDVRPLSEPPHSHGLACGGARFIPPHVLNPSMELVHPVDRELRSRALQLVLRTRRHVAMYDPQSEEVILQANTVQPLDSDNSLPAGQELRSPAPRPDTPKCPTCLRPWSVHGQTYIEELPPVDMQGDWFSPVSEPEEDDPRTHQVAPNYFRLLARATSVSVHDTPTSSRQTTPLRTGRDSSRLDEQTANQGYYERFFVELQRLGRGSRGSVFLCQHVLNGCKLGLYAIKKVPVGDNADSLLRSLSEVHLMEELNHPNVVHYKHAWVEMSQASPFTPRVPTLHVLMMAANGGSLADWIAARSGDTSTSTSSTGEDEVGGHGVTSAQVRQLKTAFRRRRQASSSWSDTGVGVHLLGEEEIVHLLRDITRGLGFLHDRGILHLDLKPGNVLLHWDADALLPTAMLSDFGSSVHLHENYMRKRSGNTGTMEYMAPEAVLRDPRSGEFGELTSKADIWSLGILFHLLVFFDVPYPQVDDIDQLRRDIQEFTSLEQVMERRGRKERRTGVHPVLFELLARMLSRDPGSRPSCGEILRVLDAYPHMDRGSRRMPNVRPGAFELRARPRGHPRPLDDPVRRSFSEGHGPWLKPEGREMTRLSPSPPNTTAVPVHVPPAAQAWPAGWLPAWIPPALPIGGVLAALLGLAKVRASLACLALTVTVCPGRGDVRRRAKRSASAALRAALTLSA